jgi:putative DNA primase/helicase
MMSGLQKEGPELSSNPGPENGTSTVTLPAHILTQAGSVDNEEPNGFSILTAALGYARRGWYVFPCRSEDKRPLTEHGFKDASLDPAQIREWWTRHPEALIGVDCGRSGLVVIDCDVKNGVDGPGNWLKIAAKAGFDPTEALHSRTQSGGEHFIFADSSHGAIASSAGKLAPGIDIRANGGYVIVPPGRGTAGNYQALGDWAKSPGVLPSALTDRLLHLKEKPLSVGNPAKASRVDPFSGSIYGRAALAAECQDIARSPEGQRNSRLNQAAFSLGQLVAGNELSRNEVESALRQAALQAGLEEQETERTLQSGLEAGMLQPRSRPETNQQAVAMAKKLEADGFPLFERDWKTSHYVALLRKEGYAFRMNELDNSVECNEEPLTDDMESSLRCLLHNYGLRRFQIARDAYIDEARRHRYHPVRKYLESLQWDGQDHIAQFCSCFEDPTGNFAVFFRRWIVGAVARAYEMTQNRVLIIDGPQGIGKSHAVSWLASPMRDYYIEGAVNPDSKDHLLRLAQIWVWEISELGNTTRKADADALKDFLTQGTITVRKPYGRLEIKKPALASFIGTVNAVGGILNDPTGSRRFMTAYVGRIDWNYAKESPDQLWAQALVLYRQGEAWHLLPEEARQAQAINDEYTIEDPIIDYIRRHFEIDPRRNDWFTPTIEIIDCLKTEGCRFVSDKLAAMAISAALFPIKPTQRRTGGQPVRGYPGIKTR